MDLNAILCLEKQCLHTHIQSHRRNHKCVTDFHLSLAVAINKDRAQGGTGKLSKKLETIKNAHSCVKTKALMDAAGLVVENASSWLEVRLSSNLNLVLTVVNHLYAMKQINTLECYVIHIRKALAKVEKVNGGLY